MKTITTFILCLMAMNATAQQPLLIGKWYLSNNDKIDTSQPDLEIDKDYKVKFKHTLCKNPCRFHFESSMSQDTIFYKTTLYCLDIKTKQTIRKADEYIEKYVIEYIDKKSLTLYNINRKIRVSYAKK